METGQKAAEVNTKRIIVPYDSEDDESPTENPTT